MDKTKQEIRDEIIREARESEERFAEAMRELENDPAWQKIQKWVVMDGAWDKEKLLECGVTVKSVMGAEKWELNKDSYCYVTNFSSLNVSGANLKECIFSNCGQIRLEDCTAENCVFTQTDTVILDNTQLQRCKFEDMHCAQGGFIISMEDSSVSESKFKNIRLENGCYLADGVGDCLIESSHFENISTDREDGELFACENTARGLLRRKKPYDMVDRDRCTGV